ncbi:PilZ domain-containing protein [Candidatus Electronema sp. PJ]|uniref:PilZ domain-containing protein n=1 Tax=Candidatus Electronema sp. PJ TaxID=3401572 RepID=UPI003AA9D12F
MEGKVEKRRQARMKLQGYIADIADGHLVYAGILEDVSLDGLRLYELPEKFSVEGKKYTLVVSGGPDSACYKLKVFPRWRRKNGTMMDVGFNIVESPVGWKKFVQKIMPKQQTVIAEDEDSHWDQNTGSSRD